MVHDPTEKSLTLPLTVVSLIDLGRLQRELEAVELFLAQATARQPGKSISLPRTTHNLDAICELNKLNLLVEADRTRLGSFLKNVRAHAPQVHISFASDPSAAFLQKVISWFRTGIHPLTILQVGLQPTIAAGCVLRTNSKYFDLSLRKDFYANRPILIDRIRQTRMSKPEAPASISPTNPPSNPADLKEYSFNRPVANDSTNNPPPAASETPEIPSAEAHNG